MLGYSKEQQIGKRLIPKQKDRTKITKKEYDNVIENVGSRCMQCMKTPIEMHHVMFRSQGGKGTWRNLQPLCKFHHHQIHSHKSFSDGARKLHRLKYGEYYWCDKYDLFQMGIIENPDDEEFEAFMLTQVPKEPEPEPDMSHLYPF